MSLGTRLLEHVCRTGLPGEKQNHAGRQHRAHLDRRLDSVDAWHDHIRDQHIWHETLRYLERLLAAVNCARIEASLIQDHRKRVRDYFFVIGYYDPWSSFQHRYPVRTARFGGTWASLNISRDRKESIRGRTLLCAIEET